MLCCGVCPFFFYVILHMQAKCLKKENVYSNGKLSSTFQGLQSRSLLHSPLLCDVLFFFDISLISFAEKLKLRYSVTLKE